eukprot:10286429-Alexandrium_andersonii.AAC.1
MTLAIEVIVVLALLVVRVLALHLAVGLALAAALVLALARLATTLGDCVDVHRSRLLLRRRAGADLGSHERLAS